MIWEVLKAKTEGVGRCWLWFWVDPGISNESSSTELCTLCSSRIPGRLLEFQVLLRFIFVDTKCQEGTWILLPSWPIGLELYLKQDLIESNIRDLSHPLISKMSISTFCGYSLLSSCVLKQIIKKPIHNRVQWNISQYHLYSDYERVFIFSLELRSQWLGEPLLPEENIRIP